MLLVSTRNEDTGADITDRNNRLHAAYTQNGYIETRDLFIRSILLLPSQFFNFRILLPFDVVGIHVRINNR